MKALIAAGVLIMGSLVAGCGDPCAGLAKPSQEERDLVANGVELEREGQWDTECQLNNNGKWEQD